jgi:hypothetical protein
VAYIVSRWTHRKHIRCLAMDICEPHRKHFLPYLSYCCVRVLWALPSNRYPIVPLVCFCGNVFSDPLPSSGHASRYRPVVPVKNKLEQQGHTVKRLGL